ncbi:MAG TPA: hypothetical protein ENJ20_00455 [Bacteroidetes bacterium]|nr:hypothetical protein [Bacteroidota bacterium]
MAKKNKSYGSYLALGNLSASLILKNLPFVLFLGFLSVIYIANAHFAEKQIRQIQTLQHEVKDLKRQYNALKSENMFNSRLVEIEKEVRGLGLTKKAGRIKRIIIEE